MAENTKNTELRQEREVAAVQEMKTAGRDAVEYPLVSIAIPAYRPGSIFRDTLASCLRQDYPDVEVVVALDGEDNEVRAAIADARDPRVRLIVDGSRQGQFGNFNRAVDESQGEFVKLLSADDLLAHDCISIMARIMREWSEVGLCAAPNICFCSREDGSLEDWLEIPRSTGRTQWVFQPRQGRWFTARYGNQIGGPSNVMIRRSAWWQTGGFDPRMNHSGEQDLWYRLVARTGLILIDRPLIAYRMHANSITGRGAMTYDRIEQPFLIAETATLGAIFPNARWWERKLRVLQTLNSTAGYAASLMRRSLSKGLVAVWRVLTAGGALLLPLTALLALWVVVRSSLRGLSTQWPFGQFFVGVRRRVPRLDLDLLGQILDQPEAATGLRDASREASADGRSDPPSHSRENGSGAAR